MTLPTGMTDLEEDLSGPNGQERKAALLARLSELHHSIIALSQKGMPVEDHEKAEKTLKALAAAHDLVVKYPVGQLSA